MNIDKIKSERIDRRAEIDIAELDAEAPGDAPITVAFASETPVPEWFGTEVIAHDADSMDLSLTQDGTVPGKWNHDEIGYPLFRAHNLRIDADRVSRAEIVFSRRAEAQQVRQDVLDGIIRSVSFRAERRVVEEQPSGIITRRWAPFELAFVDVPADNSVGVNRRNSPSQDDTTGDQAMADEKGGGTPKGADLNVVQFEAEMERAKAQGALDGARIEAKRRKEIGEVFRSRMGIAAFAALHDALANDPEIPVEVARAKYYELLEHHSGPAIGAPQKQESGSAEITRDRRDGWIEGVTQALMIRGRLITDKEKIREAQGNEFRGMTLLEIARSSLLEAGLRPGGDRRQIIGQALTRSVVGSHTSSDFVHVLNDIAGKSALMGWEEADETWARFTRPGELRDFKETEKVGLGSASRLERVGEDGEIKYGTIGDTGQKIKLYTWARLYKITREALINDDVGVFTDLPRKFGRAASRTVGDEVWDVLLLNPNMDDGNPLFSVARGNYVDLGNGAGPSVKAWDAASAAMGLQTDIDGNVINAIPTVVLAGRSLEGTNRVLLSSQYDPQGLAGATGGAVSANTWQDRLVLITDARVDQAAQPAAATRWYFSTDPTFTDTIEVDFLDGNQEPYIETAEQVTVEGVVSKVRLDFGVRALDYRGLYLNEGQ